MVIQAWILLVVYLIFTVLTAYQIREANPGYIAGFVIWWAIFIAVVVYDTNCLVVGDCNVWSWIRTILYLLLPIVVIIVLFVFMAKQKKNNKERLKALLVMSCSNLSVLVALSFLNLTTFMIPIT